MKLLFKNYIVGQIKSFAQDDGNWMVGDIELTPLAKTLRPFLESLTDEEHDATDGPERFPTEYWQESNWVIVDDDNNEKEIELPAVHFDESSIYWRWK